MSTRTDYAQLAAKVDYAALEKKLSQLAQRAPPKKRRTAEDLLEPLREKLVALYRKGWSSAQLVEELKAAGVPVNPARMRECLNRWTGNGKRTMKSRASRTGKNKGDNGQSTTPVSQVARSKSATAAGQSALQLDDL